MIYIIGYILAFIVLVYNESRYSFLNKFDLITYAVMASPSWLIVICELPAFIRSITKNNDKESEVTNENCKDNNDNI